VFQSGLLKRTLVARAFFIVAGTTLSIFAVAPASAELVYGVTQQDILVSWDSASPNNIISGFAITGLSQNETVQAIDFRPATGQLYALGSQSQIYTINLANGVATAVGDGFAPPAANGANFGLDFNPTVDLIRLTSDANQNLAISPITGEVTAAGANLNYASGLDPNVVHSAYSNNVAGALTTTLYGIDTGTDNLVIQNPPASGNLTVVGGLGLNVAEDGGFDISGATGTAYAALRRADQSVSGFYTIDLTSGLATFVGQIGGGVNIRAMSVFIPGPGAIALLAMGLMAIPRRRRTLG
jgi:hypothetical protein